MSEALSGLSGIACLMDDILVYGETCEEHDERLCQVLQCLSDRGVTLNAANYSFAQTAVKFLRQLVDHQGIRPDPHKVNAIVYFTIPAYVRDIRRFLGMASQLSMFLPNLTDITQPLRDLLAKDRAWVREEAQEQAFIAVKAALTASPVLALFNLNLDMVLSADASSFGLEAVLLQQQASRELQPVAYISRAMTSTEKHYAQIEKEALAFTWACEHLSDYLVGLCFNIYTDHKPLVPLFSTNSLEELPLRVQRFSMHMMHYNFTISHVPGKELTIADSLSRAPALSSSPADMELKQEATAYVNSVVENFPATEQ